MDIEQYREVMKEKLNKAREEMDEKHTKISIHIDHVRRSSREKNDVLRDNLNEIEKKLDRFYETDKDLWLLLKADIEDLWKRVELLMEI